MKIFKRKEDNIMTSANNSNTALQITKFDFMETT